MGYLLSTNPNNSSNQENNCYARVKFSEVKQTLCELFVYYLWFIADYLQIVCGLFVIIGTRSMRTHPILSSQRGASAEFQLRAEAQQHFGVSPPPCAAAASSSIASDRIYSVSRRGLGKAAALLPTVGVHLETISGRHRPWSMGMSSHLRRRACAKWLAATGVQP